MRAAAASVRWLWWRRALLLGGLVLAVAGAARAGGTVVSGPEARQWLLRMHNAATQRNYQGTLVVSSASSMTSSRLVHYCEGKDTYERVEVLDGQPRDLLRHNDQVLTLWPAAKLARLEQRDALPPFPSLLKGSEDELFERYEMLSEGSGRVAGLEAKIFLLQPRDGARFAQRLWAEPASGLLLRADVIGEGGRVLETSAFSDITIDSKARPKSVQAALKKLDGWRVQRTVSQRTSLESEGWQLKAPVAGFRQSSCVKRQLGAMPDEANQQPAEVVQAIFTDGLTRVSLFIEPYQAGRHRSGGAVMGATHSWMQAHGDHWVTVVGDVPMGTLKQFAAALQRKAR